jgi:nucleoside-diphosphate-sugar epimerase
MSDKGKIIVTGGAGFIGSHLVKRLVDSGKEVIIVDDFSSGKMENIFNLGVRKSQLEIRKVDLTNYK